jgi:hypothetical protein
MPQRGVLTLSLVISLLASLNACSSGGSNKPGFQPTGTAGSTSAGTAGATASGTAGDNGGGTAGQTSAGTAGDNGGGTAGQTTAGTAGDNGSGTAGDSGGGTAGQTTAGTGGQAGAGAGGAPGTAGTGVTGGGGRPSGPSAGCMKDVPNEPIGQAVLHMIDITGMATQYTAGYTHRKYCTTIPKNYNATTPYPVVFYGPGCGATACEGSSFNGRSDIFYVQAIAGADAKGTALVPPNSSPGCFQAGVNSTVDSPEGPYFDQVMNEVESKYCTDRGKIFAAGTSSGGWLSNYLACARGNRVRAIAADSGGIQYDRPACTGGAAAMEFPGDSASKTDAAGHAIGVAVARDLFIKQNGCSMTSTMMTFGTANCQYYGNCASPVVWCDTGGSHQAGNSYLSPSGWAFWKMLQ